MFFDICVDCDSLLNCNKQKTVKMGKEKNLRKKIRNGSKPIHSFQEKLKQGYYIIEYLVDKRNYKGTVSIDRIFFTLKEDCYKEVEYVIISRVTFFG